MGEEPNGKQMCSFLVLRHLHSCICKTRRKSWKHLCAIVVRRRLMLWSQVCIYESIHWAWVLAVKSYRTQKVLKLIMDRILGQKAGDSEKKAKTKINVYNLPVFRKDLRQWEDFSFKLSEIRGRRGGEKMWGRREKARPVGWMKKGLWRGVGGDGGGWRWN